jgi:hypothetical protein
MKDILDFVSAMIADSNGQKVQFWAARTDSPWDSCVWFDYNRDKESAAISFLAKCKWRLKPPEPVVTEIWVNTEGNGVPIAWITELCAIPVRDWEYAKTPTCNKRYKITAEEWPEE